MGSESDHAVYPQCELVIKANKMSESDTLFTFPYADNTSQSIKMLFDKLKKSYSLNVEVVDYVLEPELQSSITSQCINSYGKTNGIIVDNIILYSRLSLPPMNKPEKKQYAIPTLSEAIKFISKPFIVKVKKMINLTGEIIGLEISTNKGNTYYLPVEHTKDNTLKEYSVSTSDIIMPIPTMPSGLDIYNLHKKLARYLSEMIIYLFSVYLKENGIIRDDKLVRDIQPTDVVKFVKEKIVVSESVVYGMIPKKLAVDNEGLMRKGKLVLTNNEVLTRLVYVLRLEISRNLNKIIQYHKKINIENYIQDINDYKTYPSQVILYGKSSIEKYMEDINRVYKVHDKIMFDTELPYFFKNTILGLNVYLAKNDRMTSCPSYAVYNYINRYTINYVSGDVASPCILLAYRRSVEDEVSYTVLKRLT